VVVGRGRVRERAVGVQRQRAVRRAADQDGGQGVAVHVGVVAEHAGGSHRQGRVLGGGVGVVGGHGGVVDRGDGEGDGGRAGVGLAVVGLVGEAVGAVVVGRRRVAEGAISVQGQGAV